MFPGRAMPATGFAATTLRETTWERLVAFGREKSERERAQRLDHERDEQRAIRCPAQRRETVELIISLSILDSYVLALT
jgi:hypothetical protein